MTSRFDNLIYVCLVVYISICSLISCKSLTTQTALNIPVIELISGKQQPIIQKTAAYYAVVFFSPTCPVCRSTIVEIEDLGAKFNDSVLSIAVVLPPACLADTLLLKQEFTRPLANIHFYADKNFLLARALHAKITPQGYLLNKNGEILYTGMLNDYYININVHRIQISRHYIDEAIMADINHLPVKSSHTLPIGCYIEY